MIRLSAAAEAALSDLTNHDAARGRDRAIDLLAANVAAACARYERQRGLFYAVPRPYPGLASLGFRWTKEGPYWIACLETESGPVVAGIFHAAADMPNRV